MTINYLAFTILRPGTARLAKFESTSRLKPSPSRGFQVKPGRNITTCSWTAASKGVYSLDIPIHLLEASIMTSKTRKPLIPIVISIQSTGQNLVSTGLTSGLL